MILLIGLLRSGLMKREESISLQANVSNLAGSFKQGAKYSVSW